jgi:large subunit ribosomal protein L24
MKIHKNDNVIVIAGKDKGKTGKVLKAIPKEGKIVVEGIGMVKKHQRPTRSGQKGQVIEKAMPIHVSNVRLADVKKPKKLAKVVKKA